MGGGFTGLWTAIHLRQADPSLDVVVVEAGTCGGQASGRNGGFVMTAWSKFATLQKVCGTDDARFYAHTVERAVTDIGAFCDAQGIDAHFRQGGWLWTATNRAQIDAWRYTVDQLAAVGGSPYELLESDEVARRSGSPAHLAGIFEAAPAAIHPGRLVVGLADVARRLGVTIVEGCSMTELRGGATPEVITPRGSIRADKVVLAISAWSTAIPEIRRSLIVIASDVIATDPIPRRLSAIGWAPGLSISDSRRLVNYYRTTDDGRVAFGKGGGGLALGSRISDAFNRSPAAARDVTAQFQRIYPMLSDVPIDRHWRGAVDYSATGLPFVGPLAKQPRILVAAGFSGNGVGPSYVAATALTDLALERDVERVPESMRMPRGARMPPEPVRYLAGRVVREAVRRKEDAEDLGRMPGRVLSMVASLDPTSFTDVGPVNGGNGASAPASARR
ncbi:Gamma-glutamylputrescine oxidoreductase [Capillimicrobium parvum]|uniref:Gamma-glutamylputrescine oxidoreductase n=1 Tax=Capillimicrobium parvum TaxID=2884022 RepID=A0A9E6XWF7_9ACTN|nr:Gamma-glutamylputrescine oxidoreductase [Capillimicrobium parvum]